MIQFIDLTIEPLDVFADLCTDAGWCTAGAVLLSHAHLHQLATASNQDCQLLRRYIGQRPYFRTHCLSKMRQDLSVDTVRLRQFARGFGEITRLPGIDCHDRQLGCGQSSHDRQMDSSGRLQHNEDGFDLSQSFDQITECGFVVGNLPGLASWPDGYLEGVREICDRYQVLLIADEVMCGMGRTGTLFACEQEGIAPDLIAIAKGLGAGYQAID